MSETVEIFVIMEKGRVEGLVLPRKTKISELLVLLKQQKGAHEEVMLFEEDGEDVVNLEEELHVQGRRRLVCHRHHSVHVTVQYNGEKIEKSFQPGKTIKRIQEWAVDAFHLERGKWGLHRDGIDGTLVDEKAHIGSLVHYPEDKITLYLVESQKIQG